MNSTDVTYSAGAVARTLGVSPATLRTWARRYGVEPSFRSEGSHRRYSAADLEMLRRMQALMRSGVSVGEAAALARDGGTVTGLSVVPDPAPDPPEGDASPSRLQPAPAMCRSLWEAARALDAGRCADIVARSVQECGVIATWDALIRPALVRAGEDWRARQSGVEVEHVLSDAVSVGLAPVAETRSAGVLLAAAPQEDHVLPLLALRAALAEKGIGALVLTARTPKKALADSVERAHPGVVIVGAQLPANADPDLLNDLPRIRPRPALGVAGPGWTGRVPEGATHLNGLGMAVDFVTDSLSALP